MFSTTLNHLKVKTTSPSQRESLVNLLKNAEKQAKTDERILFLTKCRKKEVCPRFLTDCLQSAKYVLGDSGRMRSINDMYLHKCLNECIKSTYRRQAYLQREHKRLCHEAHNLPLFHWTMERCNVLYHQERLKTNETLSKKLRRLIADKEQHDDLAERDEVEASKREENVGAQENGDMCLHHDNESDCVTYMHQRDTATGVNEDGKEVVDQADSLTTKARGLVTEAADKKDDNEDDAMYDVWEDAMEETIIAEVGQDATEEQTTDHNSTTKTKTKAEYDNVEEEDDGDDGNKGGDEGSDISDMEVWQHATEGTGTNVYVEVGQYATEGKGPDKDMEVWHDATLADHVGDQASEIGRVVTEEIVCDLVSMDRWYDAIAEGIKADTRGEGTETDVEVWHDAISECDKGYQTSDSWHDVTEDVGCVCDGMDVWYDAIAEGIDNDKCEMTGLRQKADSLTSETVTTKIDSEPIKFQNFSDKPISRELTKLLEKGPNFALSRKIDPHTMLEVEGGLERGAFALRWKEEIESKRKSSSETAQTETDAEGGAGGGAHKLTLKPRFSDTPTRQAPTAGQETEHSIKQFKHKVMTLYKNHKQSTKPNHNKDDIGMLKDLRKDPSVIVKKSDKCKGLVIMSRDDYVKKAEAIVNDYERVKNNPTPNLDKTTCKLVHDTMDDKFSEKFVDAIKPSESRTAELYGLPKTHKPGAPLRPIVSGCGDPLDKLSWVLERIITQLLVFVPAHLKNTYDYLNKLNNKFPNFSFPKGTIAFTVDVNNLYGNIPTQEAIESTIKMIKRHKTKINIFDFSITDIQILLEHCLSNNFVRFGDKTYRQTKGIAMGNRVAPPLAILFMDAVESLVLSDDRLQPDMYLRYIDDILGIWTHGPKALDEYFEFLNSFHPALKFSLERSDKSTGNQIPFLDTLLTVHTSGNFTTELYIKPMAAPIILHFKSAHPMQTKRSVIHSQTLRALRLGSTTDTRNRGVQKIKDLFMANGYPQQLITNIQKKTQYHEHHTHTKTEKNVHITSIHR